MDKSTSRAKSTYRKSTSSIKYVWNKYVKDRSRRIAEVSGRYTTYSTKYVYLDKSTSKKKIRIEKVRYEVRISLRYVQSPALATNHLVFVQ